METFNLFAAPEAPIVSARRRPAAVPGRLCRAGRFVGFAPKTRWVARPLIILTLLLLSLSGGEAAACSGPGAWATIQEAERVGMAWGGGAIAVLATAGVWAWRGSRFWRILPLALMVPVQPTFWVSAHQGDCGTMLRLSAPLFAGLTVLIAALVVIWPRREDTARRWGVAGALAGSVPGLLVGALVLVEPTPMSVEHLIIANALAASAALGGFLLGRWLRRWWLQGRAAFRFGLRGLLLVPVVLGPWLALLMPVLPFEYSKSLPTPVRFVVRNETTGEPIVGAKVQTIDPRFAAKDQGEPVTTGWDGRCEPGLMTHVRGRSGWLKAIEVESLEPPLVRIEAPGFAPMVTTLTSEPLPNAPPLTDRPLGLSYPPPPVVTIRLHPAR